MPFTVGLVDKICCKNIGNAINSSLKEILRALRQRQKAAGTERASQKLRGRKGKQRAHFSWPLNESRDQPGPRALFLVLEGMCRAVRMQAHGILSGGSREGTPPSLKAGERRSHLRGRASAGEALSIPVDPVQLKLQPLITFQHKLLPMFLVGGREWNSPVVTATFGFVLPVP